MKVQRLDFNYDTQVVEPDPNGDLVEYADYQRLLEHYKALLEVVAKNPVRQSDLVSIVRRFAEE